MRNPRRSIETDGKTLSEIRAEAGMLGAQALKNKFETEEEYRQHLIDAARKGAQRTHELYKIEPYEQSDYMMVDRATGMPVARLSGKPIPEWMKEMNESNQ